MSFPRFSLSLKIEPGADRVFFSKRKSPIPILGFLPRELSHGARKMSAAGDMPVSTKETSARDRKTISIHDLDTRNVGMNLFSSRHSLTNTWRGKIFIHKY